MTTEVYFALHDESMSFVCVNLIGVAFPLMQYDDVCFRATFTHAVVRVYKLYDNFTVS